MATTEKPQSPRNAPLDLLLVIRNSGALQDRALTEIKAKVLRGDYPSDPVPLAQRLVADGLLTEYQTKRFLAGKSHGLLIGRYVITDRLGSGSMGRVYKAHHQMMDRYVALKVIAPEIVTNDKVVARFQREMKLVGRLDHPNVIRAFDADQVHKVLYIVMEYARGISLGQRLRKGTVPAAEMAEYGAQAALGLAHAHSQGIVHRDVKPSNLLVTEERQLKVLDLGLGVLMEADSSATFATADGIAVGTVDYMSPEQACGREVDGRSDLYSLGCSMYHLISGRLAFPGDSPIERMGKRINGQPVPITDVAPQVPSSLARVIDRLLANKPADRYQGGEEVAEALRAVLRPRTKTRPAGDPPPAPSQDAPLPAAHEPGPPSVPSEPAYPGWFRPVTALVARRPSLALSACLGVLIAAFGTGVLIGKLLR